MAGHKEAAREKENIVNDPPNLFIYLDKCNLTLCLATGVEAKIHFYILRERISLLLFTSKHLQQHMHILSILYFNSSSIYSINYNKCTIKLRK
jgi:hypothetical protein